MTVVGRGGSGGREMAIDTSVLDELRLLGEPDGSQFLIELVDEFVGDTERRLSLIDDALDADDAPTVTGLAHGLKGSSAQLGFQRLAASCAALERLALTGSLTGAAAELEQVGVRYLELREALTEALPGVGGAATPE